MKLTWEVYTSKQSLQNETELQEGVNHIVIDTDGEKLRYAGAKTQISWKKNMSVFMNGFQSWSTCPEYGRYDRVRGIDTIPAPLLNRWHFDRYADYHFVNYPNQRGITHGFSWCCFHAGEHYQLIASLDEKPGYTMFEYNAESGELKIERDCYGFVSTGPYHVFDLFMAEGSQEDVFDRWFAAMDIHPRTEKKLYGYSSWYNRYQNISEETIYSDLNGCGRILQRGDLFQIDDGWEPFVGDWLETDSVKFPDGLKGMVEEIHNRGYKAGLWVSPFAAEANSQLVKDHPDWLIRVNGEPWAQGGNWSGFYGLNIDHPGVVKYVRRVFDRIFNEWGFDLVKLDFLYAAAPFGTRKETRAARMYRAVDLLRDCAGDKEILGCGVPLMPAFGKFEYCRIGCDVTLDWNDRLYMHGFHRERPSSRNSLANTVSRRQLNGRAWLNDPDVFFVRDENLDLSDSQKEAMIRLDALLGGVFLTSDDPGSYSPQMIETYKEMRHLSEAQDVHVSTKDDIIVVDYTLDGFREREIFNIRLKPDRA